MNKNFQFNTIYVIESLFDQDEKTGEILFNDTIKRNSERTGLFHTKFLSVTDKTTLIEYLKLINSNSKNQYHPFIHFEIHGSNGKDGLVLNSGELVTWNELADETRQINLTTKNNLVISLATCYGAYFCKEMNILKAAPFCGCVCATSAIPTIEIIPRFTIFFETLFETLDFDLAITQLNEANNFDYRFKFMTCDKLFEDLFNQMEKEELNVNSIIFENWVNNIAEVLKHSSTTFETTPKEQIQYQFRNELIRKTSSIKEELRKSFLIQDLR